MAARELISASRLSWLRGQIASWRAAGLVGPAESQAIAASLSDALRARAARTILLIGAGCSAPA